MSAFSASVVSGDIGFNIVFKFTTDGAEFSGVFHRADTISPETWEALCGCGTHPVLIKSSIPTGVRHITAAATTSDTSLIMFSLNGPPVFVASVYTDDMVTREVLRRLGVRIAAAFATLEEQSE